MAAYTTLISYLFLTSYLFANAKLNPFHHKEIRNNLIKIASLLISFLFVHFVLKLVLDQFFNRHLVFAVSEGLLYIAAYFFFSKKISPFTSDKSINYEKH